MAILLKTASVRVSSIQIMQVRVQNKGKSVWKSRYGGDVSEGYVDFVSTTCVNMCKVKPLESFRGYHPIIPHHNHFNSMLARKVNHYKLLAN